MRQCQAQMRTHEGNVEDVATEIESLKVRNGGMVASIFRNISHMRCKSPPPSLHLHLEKKSVQTIVS